ncbi:hypothetical protein BMS3Bbin15_01792 [archaeon BMS3Bbin15]|nr:hypothetical protein BMS3Bbin15_01792 [archaeon BMS3Bbin15]
MITAEVIFIPIGTQSTTLSRYIKAAIEAMNDSEVRVYPRAMATELEADDLETLFSAIKKGQEAIMNMGVKRVVVSLKIDIRIDKDASLEKKIDSIGFL